MSRDPERGEAVIGFEGREVAYDFGELEPVVPAWATTVHKAQCSEYTPVVVPPVTQHRPMLRRNLVYTAMTRGRRLAVAVGRPKALALGGEGRAVAPALVRARGVAGRRQLGQGPNSHH